MGDICVVCQWAISTDGRLPLALLGQVNAAAAELGATTHLAKSCGCFLGEGRACMCRGHRDGVLAGMHHRAWWLCVVCGAASCRALGQCNAWHRGGCTVVQHLRTDGLVRLPRALGAPGTFGVAAAVSSWRARPSCSHSCRSCHAVQAAHTESGVEQTMPCGLPCVAAAYVLLGAGLARCRLDELCPVMKCCVPGCVWCSAVRCLYCHIRCVRLCMSIASSWSAAAVQ